MVILALEYQDTLGLVSADGLDLVAYQVGQD